MIRTTRYRRRPAVRADGSGGIDALKKTRRKPRKLEAPEQRMLASWLDSIARVVWCHVPNGGNRNLVVGAELKREGVKRGVPDVLIFDPPPSDPTKVGVAVELKPTKRSDPTAAPTKQQLAWLAALRERNWVGLIAYGSLDAQTQLEALGFGAVGAKAGQ